MHAEWFLNYEIRLHNEYSMYIKSISVYENIYFGLIIYLKSKYEKNIINTPLIVFQSCRCYD